MSTIEMNDTKLYFEMKGSGTPILFLHDGLLDSGCWDNQFDTFAENYQVIRYDRQAYGRSGMPTEPFSSLETIRALLENLNLEQVNLIGGSIGGTMALDFTLAYPQMVTKLVTVGSTVSGLAWSDAFQQRMKTVFLPLLEDDNLDEAIERCAQDQHLIAPENASARDDLRRKLMANPRCLVNHGILAKNGLIIQTDFEAVNRLHEIKVPTLILVGEADDPNNHTHGEAIATDIPNATRMIIANAGHYPYLEQPDVFNQVVLDFLREI